jgi:hypothetical protein
MPPTPGLRSICDLIANNLDQASDFPSWRAIEPAVSRRARRDGWAGSRAGHDR